ncbi:hypothetical protein HK100_009710 [Physocladia obscura]|uniref:Uncharacterized protein n=1 Tax=Physocladia obscura TaxID=109957 RepID=A0AAD5SLQ7_9FUNG|nr:hypothetical protein HK100_009710 [Physocladia obscura]
MASPFKLSADGIEEQFATNHLGHFAFTKVLLEAILKGDRPRIVNLTSDYHTKAPQPQGIRFESINDEKSMSSWDRYGQSKVSNILFSKQLDKLYGDKIFVNSVHPGKIRFVKTELTRGPVASTGAWVKPFLEVIKHFAALDVQDGVLTQLYAATSQDIETKSLKNRYFVPIAVDATETELIALGKNDQLAQKLWDFSEALVAEKIGSSI